MVAIMMLLTLSANPDDALIERLGHDDFDLRQRATKEIEGKIDHGLYVRLRDMQYDNHGDAEIQHRVRGIVARYENKIFAEQRKSVNVASENTDDFFWDLSELLHDFFRPW